MLPAGLRWLDIGATFCSFPGRPRLTHHNPAHLYKQSASRKRKYPSDSEVSGCSAARLFYRPGAAVEMLGKCAYDPTLGRGGEWRAATVVAVENENVTIRLEMVRLTTVSMTHYLFQRAHAHENTPRPPLPPISDPSNALRHTFLTKQKLTRSLVSSLFAGKRHVHRSSRYR